MNIRRLRLWAGGIMVAQGVVHVALSAAAARGMVPIWLDGGLWGTNTPGADGGEMVQAAAYFWSGPASFAVPWLGLGALVLWLGRNSYPVPAFIGWVIGVWGATCAAIAGPTTPFATALIPAALLVVAASRESRNPAAAEPRQPLTTP